MAVKKCPICKKAYEDVFKLGVHIETEHGSQIPKNWSGVKYNFYSTHGRTNGTCLVCKGRTEFDEKTGKPRRLCEKISCHKSYREQFRQNMMKKHGTDCLLNDPEVQKKMLMNRSIAKDYKWSDGTIKRCIGSYEYDALKFMDIFLNLNSGDVIVPAPQIIEYEYDGKTHFYIPDIYIDSLNLIIEIKDGGDNVNTHPKIQAVDKEKEKCKDLALETQTKYNYVKITNKQYGILMDTLIELKNRENIGGTNEKFDPVIMVRESVDTMVDNIVDNMRDEVDKLYVVFYHDKHLPIINKLGLLVGDSIYYYMEPNIRVDELDSVNIDFKYTVSIKDSAINTIVNHIGNYIYKDFEDDEEITMVNFPFVIMYMIISNYDSSKYNLSRYYCYNVYGLNDVENHQYIKANSKVESDKIDIEDMMNESKLINNLTSVNLYHGALEKFDILQPSAIDVGNKLQKPGWSLFCWNNKNYAIGWVLFMSIRIVKKKLDNDKDLKCLWYLPENKPCMTMDGVRKLKEYISRNKMQGYVYSISRPFYKIGIGNDVALPEFTIRERNIVPNDIDTIIITERLIDDFVKIMSKDEFEQYKKDIVDDNCKKYNRALSVFMNKDYAKKMKTKKQIYELLATGELKPFDDISKFGNGLFEETDIMNEDMEAIDYSMLSKDINKLSDKFNSVMNPMSYTHKMISKLLINIEFIYYRHVVKYYSLRETNNELRCILEKIIKLGEVYTDKSGNNLTYEQSENYIEIIKSPDYTKYISELSVNEKYNLYHINDVLFDIKPLDVDFNHIMAIKHLLDKYKSSDVLNERTMDMKPSIQLSLDQDGSLLITKHEHVDFMTIFNNSHILLKEYERVNNIEGIKYELCKLYMMKSIIDAKYIHCKGNVFTARKRDEMVKCKSFIMSDFYKYIKIVLEKDNTFNFNEYYSKTQFGIETYKIDNRLIKGLKYLTLF